MGFDERKSIFEKSVLHERHFTRDSSRTSSHYAGYVPILRERTRAAIKRTMSEAQGIDLTALKRELIAATGPGKTWSRRGLSLAAGMGPDGVRDILSGKSKNPELSSVAGLAAALELPLSTFIPNTERVAANRSTEIPVIGKVEAGVWREPYVFEGEATESIETHRPTKPGTKRYGLLVEGFSMDLVFAPGTYLDCLDVISSGVSPEAGDYVIVERQRGDLRETTCKLLEREGDGFVLRARSSKPEFSEAIPIGRLDKAHHIDAETRVAAIVLGAYQKFRDDE